MKGPSFLKIAVLSLSFLSAGVFSLKIVELHLHLGTSSAESSPLFKIEKTAINQWDITIPNDGQWHNTGLFLPPDERFLRLKPTQQGDSIGDILFRVDGEEHRVERGGSPGYGYMFGATKSETNRLIELKNEKGQINDTFQLRFSFGQK